MSLLKLQPLNTCTNSPEQWLAITTCQLVFIAHLSDINIGVLKYIFLKLLLKYRYYQVLINYLELIFGHFLAPPLLYMNKFDHICQYLTEL